MYNEESGSEGLFKAAAMQEREMKQERRSIKSGTTSSMLIL